MMKKLILLVSAFGFMLLPALVLAAFNDVRFTSNTNVSLSNGAGAATVVVTSTSEVASFAVNTSTIAIGLESGSSITLASGQNRFMYVTPAISTFSCGTATATSSLTLTSASTQSVTFSVGDICISGLAADTASAPKQITLSWTGSSTSYTVTNQTLSRTNSTSARSYTDANLSCGTQYSYTVKGTTGGVDTNTVSIVASTQLCPGYSPGLASSTNGGGGGGGGGQTPTTVTKKTTQVATTTTSTTGTVTYPTSPVTSGQTPSMTKETTTPSVTEQTSAVEFVSLPKFDSIAVGKQVIYRYRYTNRTQTTQPVRIVRQVVNAKGKVMAKATGSRTVKANTSFTIAATEKITAKFAPGAYKMEVQILNNKGKLITKNSFGIQVVKAKK